MIPPRVVGGWLEKRSWPEILKIVKGLPYYTIIYVHVQYIIPLLLIIFKERQSLSVTISPSSELVFPKGNEMLDESRLFETLIGLSPVRIVKCHCHDYYDKWSPIKNLFYLSVWVRSHNRKTLKIRLNSNEFYQFCERIHQVTFVYNRKYLPFAYCRSCFCTFIETKG